MTSRHCARQLVIKRCPTPHLQRRTFANGSAKYDELSQPAQEPLISHNTPPRPGSRGPTRKETYVDRRIRVLKEWNAQTQTAGPRFGHGRPRKTPRSFRKVPIRKVEVDVSDHEIESALKHYLSAPQKRLEEQAARDPILQVALALDPSVLSKIFAKESLDELVPRENKEQVERRSERRESGRSLKDTTTAKETSRIATQGSKDLEDGMDWRKRQSAIDKARKRGTISQERLMEMDEEERPFRQKQAAKDRERHLRWGRPLKDSEKYHEARGTQVPLRIKVPRRSRNMHGLQHTCYAVIQKWNENNLPRRTYPWARSGKALRTIHHTWPDSIELEPRFTAQDFRNFDAELSVLGAVLEERYQRQLDPRLCLQYALLKRIGRLAANLVLALVDIDWLLYKDENRASLAGAVLDSHAQRLDDWIMEVGTLVEETVPRLGPWCDTLSDEEVACKINALLALPRLYFDPRTYTGSMDPVFWPRPQDEPLGM